jgi:hypothetical protein
LGRVFRELEPYSLFPLDEYFGGTIRNALPRQSRAETVVPIRPPQGVLRPPLNLTAA